MQKPKTQFRRRRNLDSKLPSIIRKYVKILYSEGYSDNTVTHYRCQINRLKEFAKVDDYQNLNLNHVRKYLERISLTLNFSGDYINQFITAARIFYKNCLNLDFDSKGFKRHKSSHKPVEYLTFEELIFIGKQLPNIKCKTITILQYDSGLRACEALGLKKKDVDYERKVIRIIDSKNLKSRVVPLSDLSIRYLNAYFNEYKPEGDYIFPCPSNPNIPWYYSHYNLYFHKAVLDSKIGKRITTHTLRHAYATALYENGIDPHTIQTLLGHSSLETTNSYIVQSPKFLATIPSPSNLLRK